MILANGTRSSFDFRALVGNMLKSGARLRSWCRGDSCPSAQLQKVRKSLQALRSWIRDFTPDIRIRQYHGLAISCHGSFGVVCGILALGKLLFQRHQCHVFLGQRSLWRLRVPCRYDFRLHSGFIFLSSLLTSDSDMLEVPSHLDNHIQYQAWGTLCRFGDAACWFLRTYLCQPHQWDPGIFGCCFPFTPTS